ELQHLVDRVGADRKRPQVEIAGGAGSTPARIFALGGDQLDFNSDAAVAEGWNSNVEAVADFQRLDQILTQIEVDPHVVEIDQRHQRHARRNVFAGLDVALVDLRRHRRIDQHLVDDGLNGFDVGGCLLHVRYGDLTFLGRIAVDRLLVGG